MHRHTILPTQFKNNNINFNQLIIITWLSSYRSYLYSYNKKVLQYTQQERVYYMERSHKLYIQLNK